METYQENQMPKIGGYGFERAGRTELIIPNPKLKLLDQVREVMRLKRYSLRTERTYCEGRGRAPHRGL